MQTFWKRVVGVQGTQVGECIDGSVKTLEEFLSGDASVLGDVERVATDSTFREMTLGRPAQTRERRQNGRKQQTQGETATQETTTQQETAVQQPAQTEVAPEQQQTKISLVKSPPAQQSNQGKPSRK